MSRYFIFPLLGSASLTISSNFETLLSTNLKLSFNIQPKARPNFESLDEVTSKFFLFNPSKSFFKSVRLLFEQSNFSKHQVVDKSNSVNLLLLQLSSFKPKLQASISKLVR